MVEDFSFYRVYDFDWIALHRYEVEPPTCGYVTFTPDSEDVRGDRVTVAKTVKKPAVNAGAFKDLLNCWNVCALERLHVRTLAWRLVG